MNVQPLARTLDQELGALARGASLECLVCGEFVLHRGRDIACPECESRLIGAAEPGLQLRLQAG
jgi:Zn finger protein HypA/HybF involved in hydrogenase expression